MKEWRGSSAMLFIGLILKKWQSIPKKVIFFGNKANLKKLDNKTVRYLDTPLERKDKVKYLWVLFDEEIRNIIHCIIFYPKYKTLLVNALIMPYLHYCSPDWSHAAPFRLNKIDKRSSWCFRFPRQTRQLHHFWLG